MTALGHLASILRVAAGVDEDDDLAADYTGSLLWHSELATEVHSGLQQYAYCRRLVGTDRQRSARLVGDPGIRQARSRIPKTARRKASATP